VPGFSGLTLRCLRSCGRAPNPGRLPSLLTGE
jgi:hypothetical protein